MLGFRFCPRLRDFPDRKLASIELPTSYGELMQPLFGRRIKTDVIRENWDDVMRLVASLQAGVVAPSVMLKKLAAYPRQNKLDLALQELGRIERTLFMLDWLESPDLRRHVSGAAAPHCAAGAVWRQMSSMTEDDEMAKRSLRTQRALLRVIIRALAVRAPR